MSPDLHNAIMNLPCVPDTEVPAAELAFKRGHRQARHAAAELAAAHEDANAAVAAIAFALEADEGMEFLRCWNQGDFDAIRDEWPEAPEAVFIGADPLHVPTVD